MAGTTEMLGRPAPRPAYSVLGSERADPIVLPDWRQGLCRVPGRARRARRRGAMNVLVTGGAGFIGSAYVRHRLDTSSRVLRPGARQAHLRGPAREPRPARRRTAARADRRRHRRSRRGPRRARRAATRSSTSPPRRTSIARSSIRASSSRPTSSAPSSCSRPPATPASATCRSPPTRSTARSRRARSTSARRSIPRRRTRPRRPAATCWSAPFAAPTVRRADRPRLEQLRPAPVSREADPALRPQRARGRPAARLRRWPAGAQLALGLGLRRARSTPCSSAARRARSTTSAAPTSCPTSRSSGGSSRSPGATNR